MAERKIKFENGEHYHIYNRGVDGRNIFLDEHDLERFFQSMDSFNRVSPVGSFYELSFSGFKTLGGPAAKCEDRLVKIISYCLNPNHFHFILEQIKDGGISEFIKRIVGGYVWYFNNKNKRKGSLFQGRFQSSYIDNNEYLLYLSAYINLNDKVHQLGGPAAKLSRSSWKEYTEEIIGICNKGIVLDQFENKKEYKKFAEDLLEDMIENKKEVRELKWLSDFE